MLECYTTFGKLKDANQPVYFCTRERPDFKYLFVAI